MAARVSDPEILKRSPRAPTLEEWDRMTDAERQAAVDALPAHIPDEELAPPEGDPHFDAKAIPRAVLRDFFSRTGRSIYVASELAVYYPGEPRFAPDLLAVRDVDPHQRMKWVVNAEGKGLDFVMEVHVAGDMRKDLERNVPWFARLGIPEYFIYDRGRQRLSGWRLPPDGRAYQPIIPQGGRYSSEVLGLDLLIEEERLRFFNGNAMLLEASELVDKLTRMYATVEARVDEEARRADAEAEKARVEGEKARVAGEKARVEAEKARVEAEKARVEAEKARVEAERAAQAEARLKDAQARVVELERENERLRRK